MYVCELNFKKCIKKDNFKLFLLLIEINQLLPIRVRRYIKQYKRYYKRFYKFLKKEYPNEI